MSTTVTDTGVVTGAVFEHDIRGKILWKQPLITTQDTGARTILNQPQNVFASPELSYKLSLRVEGQIAPKRLTDAHPVRF